MTAVFPRAGRALRLGLVVAALLLGVCLTAGPEALAQSSLVPPPDAAAEEAAPSGPWRSLQLYAAQVQEDLRRRLPGAFRLLEVDAVEGAALLVFLSFLYGVFHAVGPGHGKIVISTYLLANESAVKRGILLAFLAALVQGLVAVVLVGGLKLVLDVTNRTVDAAAEALESASYAMIALVGCWLLRSLLSRTGVLLAGNSVAAGPETGHGPGQAEDGACCGHNHSLDPALLSRKGLGAKAWGIVAAVGLRPCLGAILVLVYATFHGLFLVGVAATAAMSFGTAVTVSALAVMTLYSKRLAIAALGGRSRWVEHAYRGLGFAGALLLILLGGVLFFGSLGGSRPF